jgi:hypothetical protein
MAWKSAVWAFLTNPKNQKTLSWLGGGMVVLASGLWAVVTFIWPSHDKAGGQANIVCAQQGGVAAGRDASHNTITITGGGATPTESAQASCADAAKPR